MPTARPSLPLLCARVLACGGRFSGGVSGEMPLCSSQADCPTGTTCTEAKWKIYQVGVCQ